MSHPALLVGVSAVLYASIVAGWSTLNAVPVARCLAGFILGIALFRLAPKIGPGPRPGHRERPWRDLAELALVPAILAVLTLASGRSAVAVVPLFAAAVLLLATGAGPVSRALESRPMQFLGRTSYSIYMVHVLGLVPFTFALKRLAGGAEYLQLPDERLVMQVEPFVGDLMLALAIPVVLALSHFTHAWIEEPGRQFGRRLADRLGPPAALPRLRGASSV
jgi:peptidoglycan/LPS O-acetylase OafA/YrhL